MPHEHLDVEQIKLRMEESRRRFLEEHVEPRGLPYIRDMVADSWTRSRSLGVDPHRPLERAQFAGKAFELLRKSYARLLESAMPYLRRLEGIVLDSDYMIALYSPQGVLFELLCSESMKRLAASLGVAPGTVFSEETVGTCANGLCSVLGKPVWIRGAEHYSDCLQGMSCVAAPVFGANKTLLGVVTMESVLTEKQSGMALGWISTVAWAIENHLNLRSSVDRLGERVEMAVDGLTELSGAFLAVDRNGLILFSNDEANRLLGSDAGTVKNRYIDEVLGDEKQLSNAVFSSSGRKSVSLSTANGGDPLHATVVHPCEKPRGAFAYIGIAKGGEREERVGPASAFVAGRSLKKPMASLREAREHGRNVLLSGARGTGKGTLARRVFGESGKPFAEIDCREIPAQFIERELYGYDDFSLCEAAGAKAGAIEKAQGGYLLVEHVDGMPPRTQQTLAAILKGCLFGKVGGSSRSKADIRVVATTELDASSLVSQGALEPELADMLGATAAIRLPELNERGNDKALLAKSFAKETAQQMRLSNGEVAQGALEAIMAYDWPGNVTQLRNCMAQAVSVSADGIVHAEHLPEFVCQPLSSAEYLVDQGELTLAELEQKAIEMALLNCAGVGKAAARLGISRATLYRKAKKYGLTGD